MQITQGPFRQSIAPNIPFKKSENLTKSTSFNLFMKNRFQSIKNVINNTLFCMVRKLVFGLHLKILQNRFQHFFANNFFLCRQKLLSYCIRGQTTLNSGCVLALRPTHFTFTYSHSMLPNY